jgi:RNA recognition motif-containing protein
MFIMANKLFVGNIDWSATEDDLRAIFAEIGEIEELVILKDRFSGRSRGFGFVTYVDQADAEEAVEKLNGFEFNGRALVVNEARPMEKRA